MYLTLRDVLSDLLNLENGKKPRALDLIFFGIKAIAIREITKYKKLLVLKHSDGEGNKDNKKK
jgi:hypothetical protein